MNRTLMFVMFFTVFLSVYFLMHLYPFFRITGFLELDRSLWMYIALILLTASFIIASILERFFHNFLIRTFYAVTASWLGFIFLLFFALLVYELIRLIFKTNDQIAAVVIIILVLILSLYGIINALFIKVNVVNLPIEGLDKELSIVQLSDIHLGTIQNSAYLKKIVSKTNSLNPDMVMITGDFADGSGKLTSETVSPLNDLKAKTFFSTGNHEMYFGVEKIEALLADTDVIVLRNKAVSYKGVQIIGIDNPAQELGSKNEAIKNIKINKSKPSILLYHVPDGIEDASSAGVSLQLSGHTHNGQLLPFKIFSRIAYKYVNGLHYYKGTYLYVSSGTGTWGPPMRIGSKNEISLIKLEKK